MAWAVPRRALRLQLLTPRHAPPHLYHTGKSVPVGGGDAFWEMRLRPAFHVLGSAAPPSACNPEPHDAIDGPGYPRAAAAMPGLLKHGRHGLWYAVAVGVLDTEINFLSQHRDELLQQYGGKFLVISGQNVIGAYDSISEALEAGTTALGTGNFLIRQPLESGMTINAPAYTLGILQSSPYDPPR